MLGGSLQLGRLANSCESILKRRHSSSQIVTLTDELHHLFPSESRHKASDFSLQPLKLGLPKCELGLPPSTAREGAVRAEE